MRSLRGGAALALTARASGLTRHYSTLKSAGAGVVTLNICVCVLLRQVALLCGSYMGYEMVTLQ